MPACRKGRRRWPTCARAPAPAAPAAGCCSWTARRSPISGRRPRAPRLIYAHLGHDPDFAEYSPGTVLQLEAMRQLMAERDFALFDFTEGEGQHKRLFATGGIDCVDLLLVRPTAGNLLAGHALGAFDGMVALAKRVLGASVARRLRR